MCLGGADRMRNKNYKYKGGETDDVGKARGFVILEKM